MSSIKTQLTSWVTYITSPGHRWIVVVAGVSVATVAAVAIARRKAAGGYEMSANIDAPARQIYDELVEPETYYNSNRKGYTPKIVERQPGLIKYVLIDDVKGLPRFITPVEHSFHENPFTVQDNFHFMNIDMQVTWTIQPAPPATSSGAIEQTGASSSSTSSTSSRSVLHLRTHFEGPWIMVQLVMAGRVELKKKIETLKNQMEHMYQRGQAAAVRPH